MNENIRAASLAHRLDFVFLVMASSTLVGCAKPTINNTRAIASPQTAVVPAPAPAPDVIVDRAQAPKSKAVSASSAMNYQAIVKMIEEGAGKEERLIGRDVVFNAKAPDKKSGFMDIDRKKGLYAQCHSGIGKFGNGKVIGKFAGSEVFDDAPPALVLKFTGCRAA